MRKPAKRLRGCEGLTEQQTNATETGDRGRRSQDTRDNSPYREEWPPARGTKGQSKQSKQERPRRAKKRKEKEEPKTRDNSPCREEWPPVRGSQETMQEQQQNTKRRARRGQDERTELRDGGSPGRARRPLEDLIVHQGNHAWEKGAYAMWGARAAANPLPLW